MIRLLQHYTPNFKPLIDISKPIHEAYCKKHGYSFHLKEVPQYEVYNGLEKLNQILEVCEDGDIALVMDADAIVTNFNYNIEDFLKEGKDFAVSKGWNMGIFILRFTNDVKFLINKLFVLIKHQHFNCEQDAFEYYMDLYSGSHGAEIVITHRHPCFNSYLSKLYPSIKQPVSIEEGEWESDCFILHLPALPLDTRSYLMKEYSQFIVYE